MMVSVFSNKSFFTEGMYIAMMLFHAGQTAVYCRRNDDTYWETETHLTSFIAIFALLWWSGTKLVLSLNYALYFPQHFSIMG